MTKAIEDELNLPRIKEALAEIEKDEAAEEAKDDVPAIDPNELQAMVENLKEIKGELRRLDDYEVNQQKVDEIQKNALDAHKDLLDAGFNVEAKHASNFLEPAMQALSTALDSEKTKINQKIQIMKLEAEKKRLELQERRVEIAERQLDGEPAEILDSNDGSFMAKRSEILRMMAEEEEDEA